MSAFRDLEKAGVSDGGIVAVVVAVVVGIAASMLGIIVAGTLVDAYVVMKLWGWFIPSAFPSMPLLAYWHAAGLMLVVRAIRPHESEPEREHTGSVKHPWLNILGRLTIGPLLVLGMGLFIHSFV